MTYEESSNSESKIEEDVWAHVKHVRFLWIKDNMNMAHKKCDLSLTKYGMLNIENSEKMLMSLKTELGL